jgi:hypothetical protein
MPKIPQFEQAKQRQRRKPKSVEVLPVKKEKKPPTTLEIVEQIDTTRNLLREALARLDALSMRVAVYGVYNTDPAFKDDIPF